MSHELMVLVPIAGGALLAVLIIAAIEELSFWSLLADGARGTWRGCIALARALVPHRTGQVWASTDARHYDPEAYVRHEFLAGRINAEEFEEQLDRVLREKEARSVL